MRLEFLKTFGKAFIPEKVRPGLRDYLSKAGFINIPYIFFGVLFFIVLLTTTGMFLSVYISLKKLSIVFLILATLGFWVLVPTLLSFVLIMFVYFFLNLKIYKRTKSLDENLADYLQLVGTNLRAGMSFEKSLWFAIRPKFGVLASEISECSKKVMTGTDASDALRQLGKKYDSPLLARTLDLIVGEVESGGRIADVIDRIRSNLKETQELKAEMASSVVSFVIFIAVIVLVIAPVLFALAFQLMGIMTGITDKLASSGSGGAGGGGSFDFSKAKKNDPAEFKTFSYIAIGLIAIFASMITSVITSGNVLDGLKYIPVYMIVAVIVYGLATSFLASMFSGMAL